MVCRHCHVELAPNELDHIEDHPELCCDCFDLSCGQDLDSLNAERAEKGRPPISEPWPGRDREGNKEKETHEQ